MPRYKKAGTGHQDFQPGNPGGPGRPKDPPELKALKALTKKEMECLVHKILNAEPSKLKEFNKTVLQLWLSQGAYKAIQQGDYNRLMLLIDRLYGKVKDQVEVKHDFSQMSDEELLKEAERLIQDIKKGKEN